MTITYLEMMNAVSAGTALLARIGLKPSTLSKAGTLIKTGLHKHGPALGTAATIASFLPTGGRGGAVRTAATRSDAGGYVSRYRAARA